MVNKFFLFLMFLFCSFCYNAQNDTILELFKSTQLAGKKKLELQANISTIEDIVIKDSETRYRLKKESYGVADSISLEVNSKKQINAIYFYYQYEPEFSNDTAYIHELRKYKNVISPNGKEQKTIYKNGSVKMTKWESKNVIFELVEITENGRKKTHSRIIDKKYFPYPNIDLKKEKSLSEAKKKVS